MACKAVGIDLGTTNSSVAVYKNGRVDVVANDYSNRMTPSCVAFTDNETLVGEAAKDQQISNPANTVVAVKRLIGRRFSDACVQGDIKHWPFKVIAGDDDVPLIEVKNMRGTKRYSAEEISSMVLVHMKKIAENYLDHPVTDAVITIPASYGDAQRQATYKAAQLAGLNVLRLINEPTAAALAYGFDNVAVGGKDRLIMVFDLGGGTLDVSILLNSKTNQFEVKASAGNSHLGGDDFDNRLTEHVASANKTSAITSALRSFWENLSSRCRLSSICERAKRALTGNTTSVIDTACFQVGSKTSTMTRAKFESLCADLFEKALLPVEQALKVAKLNKTDIDEIVLAGGASRMPKIQTMLQEYFNGKQLSKTINPDEAVAYGAAILAAKMSGNKTDRVARMKFVDITSFSLSIENVFGDSVVSVPRGAKVPVKVKQDWETSYDNMANTIFKIYEGENIKAKNNYFLGSFYVKGLPPKPKGEVKFVSTVEIDESGILHVTSIEKSMGLKNGISFTRRIV